MDSIRFHLRDQVASKLKQVAARGDRNLGAREIGIRAHGGRRGQRRHGRATRYFLSRGGVAVAGAGIEPPGASGMAGAFFGFLASLLPR
jgi:hypothetical protein